MWSVWRRLAQSQQDLLLAALIGLVWFAALNLINGSGLRPQNPAVSVVTGIFLVATVAFGRRIPRTMLVIVSVLYPFLYAAVGTGLAAQVGITVFGQPEISDAALQSEIHLVPLLVVGYLAASSGVRRFTCLFFTMGSLAGTDDRPADRGRDRPQPREPRDPVRRSVPEAARATCRASTATSTSRCSSSPRR